MAPRYKSTSIEYRVNPQDPSTYLKPGESLLDNDGRDWSWAYVIYREVRGFPGYRVGTNGTVWSSMKVRSLGGRGGFFCAPSDEWRMVKGTMAGGYVVVDVRLKPRVRYRRRVHVFILEAFIGPCPPGMEGCHYNCDRRDNRLSNLRWDTRAGNMADSVREGTMAKGSANGAAKLSEVDVESARARFARGESGTSMAWEYGVSGTTLNRAINGHTWKHVRTNET